MVETELSFILLAFDAIKLSRYYKTNEVIAFTFDERQTNLRAKTWGKQLRAFEENRGEYSRKASAVQPLLKRWISKVFRKKVAVEVVATA